jgi:hypothetical protein
MEPLLGWCQAGEGRIARFRWALDGKWHVILNAPHRPDAIGEDAQFDVAVEKAIEMFAE